jgi:hypothetical protein
MKGLKGNDEMENDLEGSGSGLVLRFYPVIRSKGLRTAKEILSQDSRYPG